MIMEKRKRDVLARWMKSKLLRQSRPQISSTLFALFEGILALLVIFCVEVKYFVQAGNRDRYIITCNNL